MLDMATKKNKTPEPAPEPKRVRNGYNINVWVSGPHGALFVKYLETVRPTPRRTAALELAIELLAKTAGLELEK